MPRKENERNFGKTSKRRKNAAAKNEAFRGRPIQVCLFFKLFNCCFFRKRRFPEIKMSDWVRSPSNLEKKFRLIYFISFVGQGSLFSKFSNVDDISYFVLRDINVLKCLQMSLNVYECSK